MVDSLICVSCLRSYFVSLSVGVRLCVQVEGKEGGGGGEGGGGLWLTLFRDNTTFAVHQIVDKDKGSCLGLRDDLKLSWILQ